MTYVYKKGQKCTKETIAEEQARLKKEPFMLDNVEKWVYYVTDKTEQQTKDHKPKQRKPKQRKPKPKSSNKKQC